MILGAPGSAPRSQARLIDLNLVPLEYRRRGFPYVTAGLTLFLAGALVLLYVLVYARTYSDYEVQALSTRVAQGQALVRSATGDPAAVARRDQLRAMRDDYQLLKQRQVNWGDVFQVVGDAPPGVQIRDVSQSGFGVTVAGSAPDQALAARYLDQLRASGLFVNASIQVNPSRAPFAAAPTLAPTPPLSPSTPVGAVILATPTIPPTQPVQSFQPPPIQPPAYQPPAYQPPSYRPPAVQPTRPAIIPPTISTTAPRLTPTIIPTATTRPSATNTVVPTPAFAWILRSSQQVPAQNAYAATSDIQGSVVDLNNQPVSGIPLEIDSADGNWSARTTTRSDGSFDFSVTHGKFQVAVVDNGSAQRASGLYTGTDGVAGVYGYRLVFQKTFSGQTPPASLGTAVPSATASATATATSSPVSLGQNIASYGCTSAYQVVGGARQNLPSNATSPGLAVDGNLNTAWNAGMAPSSGIQVIWAWQLPQVGQPCPSNTTGTNPGLPDNQALINGFQLIPDQNPAGTTDHELWLYADPNCAQNISSTNSAYITWNQSTSAGQILPLTISPAVSVRCVIVRTLVDPSFVSWKEVQIYQAVPPPSGFPSFTSTPSPTGTISPTPTTGPSGTPPPATNTPAPSPTLRIPAGVDIAQGAPVHVNGTPVTINGTAVSCSAVTVTPSATNNPCSTVDFNTSTYWVPPATSNSAQSLTVLLSSQTIVPSPVVSEIDVVIQAPPTVPNGSVTVLWKANNTWNPLPCTPSIGTSGYPDSTELSCPIPSTMSGPANEVAVEIYEGDLSANPSTYGIREVYVYATSSSPAFRSSNVGSLGPAAGPPGIVPPSPTLVRRTATATATGSSGAPSAGLLGTVKSFLGLGRGPGSEPPVASTPANVASSGAQPDATTPTPPRPPLSPGGYIAPANPASSAPTGGTLGSTGRAAAANRTVASLTTPAVPTVPVGASDPVDFTIVLEVGSGKGY